MNDFNWRLEEIRRRSSVLAKKRSRRKKRLLTVIPVVLCAAVCIPAIVSDLNTFRNAAGSRPEYVVDAVPVGQPDGSGENKGAAPPLTDGGHTAGTLTPPESAVEPGNGTVKNTKLILSDLWGDRFTITGENALQLVEILESLDYDPMKLCDCLAPYQVRTESGVTYGIHLSEGYARCDKGQADLTEEQVEILAQIINAAKEG